MPEKCPMRSLQPTGSNRYEIARLPDPTLSHSAGLLVSLSNHIHHVPTPAQEAQGDCPFLQAARLVTARRLQQSSRISLIPACRTWLRVAVLLQFPHGFAHIAHFDLSPAAFHFNFLTRRRRKSSQSKLSFDSLSNHCSANKVLA